MNFFSSIYLHKDAGAAYLPGLPVRSVVLEVDGAVAVEPFLMLLPTNKPKSINVAMIAGWLVALNGPSINASGMSSAQRELLLTLICRYCVFLKLPPGVKEKDFYKLAHKVLDVSCFLPVLDDSFKPRDPDKLSKDGITSIVTTLASMLDPRMCTAIQDININGILFNVTTSAVDPTQYPTSSMPTASVEAATETPDHPATTSAKGKSRK
uniref:Protein kinase domain-containing protein n=1 Tax=Ganoderma boninense TaxID=34458 RepID=A0A5K1JTZ2_9APHY|nr:Protein kinase domain-containing protein [Ganoderma boninense]